MPRYFALLRSVNLGGHGRLAMNELRDSFAKLGYSDVVTYIQSGNVLFDARSRSEADVVTAIEERLDQDFGEAPAVILRTVPELLRIGGASPFAKKGADPARHHVTFLAERPAKKAVTELVLPPSGRDELVVDGLEVYVHTPDGYSKSKLTGTLLERRLGVLSTTRNWNTVTKLCELAGGGR